jgi:hypothetical protein
MEAMQGQLSHLQELVLPKVVTHKNLGGMLLELFKNSVDQNVSQSKSRSSSSRKRRKKRKKKKEDGSSTSSSSSSNLSESLEEDNKLRRLARNKPGKLLLLAIKEMAALLATQTGEVSEVTLCPLFTKFYHLQMKSRLTSATQHREAQTLAKALDLLVRGEVLQSCDVLVQRSKALEVAATHGNWKAAAHMELLPTDKPLTAFRPHEGRTKMPRRRAPRKFVSSPRDVTKSDS